jgi:hypothetical protein
VSDSILETTKKVLNVPSDYGAFDVDVIMHINSVFSILNQLGIGPTQGFAIEDESATWDSFLEGDLRLNSVKSYMFLRVRMLFDPPGTSFLLAAFEKQIAELEWRINAQREDEQWTPAQT